MLYVCVNGMCVYVCLENNCLGVFLLFLFCCLLTHTYIHIYINTVALCGRWQDLGGCLVNKKAVETVLYIAFVCMNFRTGKGVPVLFFLALYSEYQQHLGRKERERGER